MKAAKLPGLIQHRYHQQQHTHLCYLSCNSVAGAAVAAVAAAPRQGADSPAQFESSNSM
jgi:hypothetical protein